MVTDINGHGEDANVKFNRTMIIGIEPNRTMNNFFFWNLG